jgi:hypothetical protein
VRSLYLYLEGSDRNALTFNFDLRDGDVDGVTMQLVGEGDDNRELIHGMAAEAYAWLDRRFGAETSWCSDAGEAFPVDGAFHKKLEKDTTCWWKVGDSTVAELTRTHHGPETPGRTYVELAVRMRLEGLPEAPSPAR